jgi:hypothetical protein
MASLQYKTIANPKLQFNQRIEPSLYGGIEPKKAHMAFLSFNHNDLHMQGYPKSRFMFPTKCKVIAWCRIIMWCTNGYKKDTNACML